MFGHSRSSREVVANVVDGISPYANGIARDPEFRRRLTLAVSAGLAARRRARSLASMAGLAARLGTDPVLREELTEAMAQLQRAQKRIEGRQRHTARTVVLVLAGTGAVAGAAMVPEVRRTLTKALHGLRPKRKASIEQEIEVGVPVRTAYNQWTQFEEFPSFMEGVDEVKQLDDTLLHWAATIAGRKAEWDAKIVEQQPDRRIVWESVDGKTTRGMVTFEPVGHDRTRVRLMMTYAAEGPAEQAGSAVGLDTLRVRGDLVRFRDLIEGRKSASGAWRGTVEGGETTGDGSSHE